jgi:hypothetical protein
VRGRGRACDSRRKNLAPPISAASRRNQFEQIASAAARARCAAPPPFVIPSPLNSLMRCTHRFNELTPSFSALALIAPATHAQSALPLAKELNLRGINTYEKMPGGRFAEASHFRKRYRVFLLFIPSYRPGFPRPARRGAGWFQKVLPDREQTNRYARRLEWDTGQCAHSGRDRSAAKPQ